MLYVEKKIWLSWHEFIFLKLKDKSHHFFLVMISSIGWRHAEGSAMKLQQFTILQHIRTPTSCLRSVPPAPTNSSGVLRRKHLLYNFTTNQKVNISYSVAKLFPTHKSSCERTLSLQTSNIHFFFLVTNSHLRLSLNINSH